MVISGRARERERETVVSSLRSLVTLLFWREREREGGGEKERVVSSLRSLVTLLLWRDREREGERCFFTAQFSNPVITEREEGGRERELFLHCAVWQPCY